MGTAGARPRGRSVQGRVYPRACGGTASSIASNFPISGLSPRVRGNLECAIREGPFNGSIPARAGEPHGFQSVSGGAGVYPRACGGTLISALVWSVVAGLSPRVRGNRVVRRWLRGDGGVYPRACGGTSVICRKRPAFRGLSPRVRGNHFKALESLGCNRSIPARAGEPTHGRILPTAVRVYPRACGGTLLYQTPQAQALGLSPRVRGNQTRPLTYRQAIRSIPARAGEPAGATVAIIGHGVYPRACGGTAVSTATTTCTSGLSPLKVAQRRMGFRPSWRCAK